MSDSSVSASPAADDSARTWSMRARTIGAVVWPSFFAAGVATVVFFAIVDPLELASITWLRVTVSRELGYTIGFFMFWLSTFSACTFTALLMLPPRPRGDSRRH